MAKSAGRAIAPVRRRCGFADTGPRPRSRRPSGCTQIQPDPKDNDRERCRRFRVRRSEFAAARTADRRSRERRRHPAQTRYSTCGRARLHRSRTSGSQAPRRWPARHSKPNLPKAIAPRAARQRVARDRRARYRAVAPGAPDGAAS